MKKILNILVFIILFIWQLPQSLVGLVMLIYFKLFGGATLITYRNYCLGFRAKRMVGGISLGNFAFLSRTSSKYAEDIAHEVDGHTVDSKILGPLYLLVIGIPSLMWAWLRNKDKHPDYFSFYTERLANWHSGLISVPYNFTYQGRTYYRLEFKDYNNKEKQ